MTTEVLTQLRTMRDGMVDALRKDPRYLTLVALDKSIAEIGKVVGTAGVAGSEPAPRQPLQFEPAGAAPAPAAPAADKKEDGGDSDEDDHPGPPSEPIEQPAALLDSAVPASAAPVTAAPEPAGVGRPTDVVPADPAPAHTPPPLPDAARADAAPTGAAPTRAADPEDAAADPEAKASGYVPMQAKPGAAQYQAAMSVRFGRLPGKVDLRPAMRPIEDQGLTNSAVAHAVSSAFETWIGRVMKQDHEISRLFVYYNARWRDGLQDEDHGSAIQLAMEGLSTFGACNTKAWPLDPDLILEKPNVAAYRQAAGFKTHDMAQVPLRLESWKQALAEGKPIVFGCLLFEPVDQCSKTGGLVTMPDPDVLAHASHGPHAMCAVGYSDAEKVFIVRNSWGTEWGDQGYCYMPYAYLMSEKLNDGDCWVFIPKTPSQAPRECWMDDTKPVTNGGKRVDVPIEPYSVEDYRKGDVDLFEDLRSPFNDNAPESFSRQAALAGKGAWAEIEQNEKQAPAGTDHAAAGIAAVEAELLSAFDFSDPHEEPGESRDAPKGRAGRG